MGLSLDFEDGQTPLDEDEKQGLRIKSITTRGELDEFEQQNIEQAVLWTMGRSLGADKIFSEAFIKSLHKRMYGEVWTWAGDFRKTNKNIGVDKWQIAGSLKALMDDALFWFANGTYSPDELAIYFKHRLVSIHCFANGNGRHSRLMADIIIEKIFKKPVFTWGAANLVKKGNARALYLAALREADRGNIEPLIQFSKG
ncbi:MAG: mobile mystery protein B [Crocinitomicaceae bacterium]|nr:MAG: mobile mystery protein B [Crocinitomicaceae bacterium]